MLYLSYKLSIEGTKISVHSKWKIKFDFRKNTLTLNIIPDIYLLLEIVLVMTSKSVDVNEFHTICMRREIIL